jgi:hypothetical protein
MTRLVGIEDVLDTDAWYTPAWLFDGLGVTFDFDVAAPADPIEWLPASRRYTVADDGLLQPWHGLVWCNPPDSEPAPWCRRWAAHPDGFLLIRSDLSTSGPAFAFSAATSMFVPAKRLQFVNGHGVGSGSVNFSSVLLGRGQTADDAIVRLAGKYGGHARLLTVRAA